jgi:hypothetical protein
LALRLSVAPAIAFVISLVVLLGSVRTAVGYWDTGDLQTVVWIAGIPYPTGFPGYVLFGWLWTHAIPLGSVAARLNALSAVAIAAGAGTVAAIALLFDVAPALAVLGGCLFAFARTIWLRGSYADAHPLGFALAFAAIALAIRWTLRGEERALGAAIVLGGIAMAVDNTTVLMLAGGVVVALGRRWPLAMALRSLGIAAVVVVAAYAYLPLRSAFVTAHGLDPTLALGLPPGRPFWDDHHPSGVDGFLQLVTGTEWTPGYTLSRLLTVDRLGAAVARYGPALGAAFPQGLLIVALGGLGAIAFSAPLVAIGLLVAVVLPASFGASYQAEADPERYAFALYALTALGVAVGADRAVRAFARTTRPALALGAAIALLCAAVLHDAASARDLVASRSDGRAADLAARVAASTRDGAIVVAPWDFATPLAYHAYVENAMGRRIVVCALPLEDLAFYPEWARRRQLAIVSDGAPDIPGFRTRLLDGSGVPEVYELVAP